jgi:hypothetical protein
MRSGHGAVVELTPHDIDTDLDAYKFDVFVGGSRPHWHRYSGSADEEVRALDPVCPIDDMGSVLLSAEGPAVSPDEARLITALTHFTIELWSATG